MKKVLKFSASWCGPCKMLAMTLKDEDIGLPVVEVDVDENPELAQKFGIRGVPTMILVDDEIEVTRFSGTKTLQEIKSWVMISA